MGTNWKGYVATGIVVAVLVVTAALAIWALLNPLPDVPAVGWNHDA